MKLKQTKTKKVIGIAFSDLHLHIYQRFNKDNHRTLNHFDILFQVKKLCNQYGCPAFFNGDLYHLPEYISQELLYLSINKFKELDDGTWEMYSISGNHDNVNINTLEKPSINFITTFAQVFNFIKLTDKVTTTLKVNGIKFNVLGLNYLDHNIGLNQFLKDYETKLPTILQLHTDYPGAKDTDGSEVGSVENLNINLLNKFRLTIIGHIHKPQRFSKKVYMVGAPLQQRRTDRDCHELGYMIIYEDFSVKYKTFKKQYPKFIDITSETDVTDDINYYTVINKPLELAENDTKNHEITTGISKIKLVKRYLKTQGIKDSEKKDLLIKILKDSEQ